MRLLYVFAICVFASVNVLAADLLPLDKDGFGGIKWGTEFSSADKLGMKECIDIGSAIICEKKDESLKEIGGVPVEVKYAFNGAYFNEVSIAFNDACQWPIITNALTEAYGKSERLFYEKNLGKVFISGNYIQYGEQRLRLGVDIKDIDIHEAAANRFDKMALSIFTMAERKSLNGFLGARWGMAVEQIQHELLLVRSVDKWKTYIQRKDLYFGLIPVDIIEYEFVDDRLDSINIYILLNSDIWQNIPRTDLLHVFVSIIESNFGEMRKAGDMSYSLLLRDTLVNVYEGGYYGLEVVISAKAFGN